MLNAENCSLCIDALPSTYAKLGFLCGRGSNSALSMSVNYTSVTGVVYQLPPGCKICWGKLIFELQGGI